MLMNSTINASSINRKAKFKVIVKYDDKDYVYEIGEDEPIGRVRLLFACQLGLKDEEFRFVTEQNGCILTDTDIIYDHDDVTVEVEEPVAAGGEEQGISETLKQLVTVEVQRPEEEGAEADEEIKVKHDSDDEEKSHGNVGLDSFLKEKLDMLSKLLGYDDPSLLMTELCKRCVDANRVDANFIYHQAKIIVQDVQNIKKSPAKQIVVLVQEGFPLFLISKGDGAKYIACVDYDTLGEVRDRFARLIGCETNHLKLRKAEEEEELTDDRLTMAELGMENGCAFDAQRTGSCIFNVIFNFDICFQVDVELGLPIESLMETIEKKALGLKDVRYFFWYHGQVVPDNTEEPLGKFLYGAHFLRVMVTLDPSLPIDMDTGPDMKVVPLEPRGPKRKEAASQGDVQGQSLQEGNQRENRDLEHNDETAEAEVRILLNQRVLRFFTLLVERELVENMRPDSPRLQPVTFDRCLPNMTLLDLRRLIEKETDEDPDDQTLFYKGRLLTYVDNYSTLRELDILGSDPLYLEPSVEVTVNMGEDMEPLLMRRGHKSTTIDDVIEWIAYKRDIPRKDIHLEINGLTALPTLSFSDFEVKDGDVFTLLRPFQVRVWQENFLYDKMVWKHTPPLELMQELQRDTDIPVKELVFAKVDSFEKVNITVNRPSIFFCGITDNVELDVWRRSEFEFCRKQKQQFAAESRASADIEAPEIMRNQFMTFEDTTSADTEAPEMMRNFEDTELASGSKFDPDRFANFITSGSIPDDDSDSDSFSED